MILLSGKFEIKEIKRKTRAKVFKDAQVGDVIKFAVNATDGGRGYAGTVQITNQTRGGSMSKSQAELDNILRDTFVLVPAQEASATDILDELYDEVQGMRESGDTDLRTVLHLIDKAARGLK